MENVVYICGQHTGQNWVSELDILSCPALPAWNPCPCACSSLAGVVHLPPPWRQEHMPLGGKGTGGQHCTRPVPPPLWSREKPLRLGRRGLRDRWREARGGASWTLNMKGLRVGWYLWILPVSLKKQNRQISWCSQTFPAIQWLRLHPSTAGGSTPGQRS